jgi:tetratricopeptide (TPR) repeat protein
MSETRAAEFKAEGNRLFGQKDYDAAAEQYTLAIDELPDSHVLYANRAACYTQPDVARFDDALADSTKCVEMAPAWAKGYTRKAQAESCLNRYADSEATCRAALQVDGVNKQVVLDQLQSLRDSNHLTDAGADAELADLDGAAEQKARGNAAFAAKGWEEAARCFTAALALNPMDHVFW